MLAIVLAPTDAALGQAVVTDPRLPVRIRQGLNVESGLNDGICVPLLFIALAIAEADEDAISAGHAVRSWSRRSGGDSSAASSPVSWARRSCATPSAEQLVADDWLQVIPLARRPLSYGIAAPLGGSGFIAAFVAGLVFGVLNRSQGGEVTYLLEANGRRYSTPSTFIVFGAVALGPALHLLDWQIALYALLSLTVVRMIPVALALRGLHPRRPTVAYVGWFGPRGLASIVFAVIVLEDSVLTHVDVVIATVLITVALSVLAHGLTALPLTDRYARWYAARPKAPEMESAAAHEHRWRRPTFSGAGEPTHD